MATDPTQTQFASDDEIRYASYQGADLRRHTFRGTILTRGNFMRATLSGVRFSVRAYRTDFAFADLHNADVSDANFFGCNFREASFRNANLSRAKFGNSNLTKVSFANAVLTDTNLLNALGLTARQLIESPTWRQAMIPEHLRSEAEGLELLRLRRENTRTLDAPIVGVAGLIDDIIDLTEPEPEAAPVAATASGRSSTDFWPAMITDPQVPTSLDPRLRPVGAPTPAVARRAAAAYRDVVRAPRPKYTETGEISVEAFEALRTR